MREKKAYLPRIVEVSVIIGKSADDRQYIVEHNPCPKFRIAIPLEESWRAADYENKAGVNEAWRRFILGLAAHLGLYADESCVDPSRLFYFPRRVSGNPVDLHSITGVGRISPRGTQGQAAAAGLDLSMGRGASSTV
jgi:hypothetical protein